jgi:hypothetical protein
MPGVAFMLVSAFNLVLNWESAQAAVRRLVAHSRHLR